MLVAVLVTITFFLGRNPVKTIDESDALATCSDAFAANIRSRMNGDDVIITVGGGSTEEFGYTFYVSDNMHLMVEGEFLRSLLLCSVQRYPDGNVLIMKGDNSISLAVGSDKATVNKKTEVELGDAVYVDEAEDRLMVPIDKIAEYLSYEVDYYVDQKWVDLARLPDETPLPEKYDMRDYGRVSPVRDQGRYGTCWAFASLGALETTLLPMEEDIFSVDHMSMCNSYALDVNSGGEHTMSIAYLAAWQGPVLEKDDPYGDGMSDPNLTAEKHLEEALIINGREDETIKSAIFRYGAIETSIYSALEYVDSYSMYYSSEYAAYYYDGDETPNHDVVVVGRDDNFPKENFTIQPEGDGAFICKNSWGEEFGDDGYFMYPIMIRRSAGNRLSTRGLATRIIMIRSTRRISLAGLDSLVSPRRMRIFPMSTRQEKMRIWQPFLSMRRIRIRSLKCMLCGILMVWTRLRTGSL